MTIQISVVLWTVICFCLAMLILDKLLFKPLFAVMDKRNARIAAAGVAAREQEREREEHREAARLAAEEALADRRRQAREALDKAEHEAAAALQAERELCRSRIIERESELASESDALETELEKGIESLAEAFAERIVS